MPDTLGVRSDGTANGTTVYNALTGEVIPNVTAVAFAVVSSDIPRLTVQVGFALIDAIGRARWVDDRMKPIRRIEYWDGTVETYPEFNP